MTPQRFTQNSSANESLMGSISKFFGFGGNNDGLKKIAESNESSSKKTQNDRKDMIKERFKARKQNINLNQENPYDTRKCVSLFWISQFSFDLISPSFTKN